MAGLVYQAEYTTNLVRRESVQSPNVMEVMDMDKDGKCAVACKTKIDGRRLGFQEEQYLDLNGI